jgi:hypothetical protein
MKWTTIWSTTSEIEGIIVQDTLQAAGIPAHMHNQKDSMYVIIGEVHVLVPISMEEQARQILTMQGLLHDKQFLN